MSARDSKKVKKSRFLKGCLYREIHSSSFPQEESFENGSLRRYVVRFSRVEVLFDFFLKLSAENRYEMKGRIRFSLEFLYQKRTFGESSAVDFLFFHVLLQGKTFEILVAFIRKEPG
jgi:hypothetical protein